MDRAFPVGLPPATAIYLTIYVLSLAAHLVCASYVLAGSGYVAVIGIFSGRRGHGPQYGAVAAMLRDWLPFVLGAAITTGVAPLLFVQILYRRAFYSANLLLSPNWVALLAALMLGFYLLYALKSQRLGKWPYPVRRVLGLVAFACFLFTGFSWTRNHLLSLQSQLWPEVYASGTFASLDFGLAPRMATWIAASIPIMCVIVAWQLRANTGLGRAVLQAECRRISFFALCGLVVSAAGATIYYVTGTDVVREAMTTSLALPYAFAAAVGWLLQAFGWIGLWNTGRFVFRWVALASAGMLATLLGILVVREAIRIGSVDMDALRRAHAAAASVAGLYVFLTFVAINAVVIILCLTMVKRRLRSAGVT